MSIIARLNGFVQSVPSFKKNTLSLVIFSLSLLQLQSCTDDQVGTDSIEPRVKEILSSMTLEQKVGQMIQGEIRYMSPQDVKDYSIGSVLNGGGAFPNNDQNASIDDWLALADAYYSASMDTSDGGAGIPIIWGTDAVHGHNNVVGATLFPHNIGLGAANDPALMRSIGEAVAKEVAVTGLDWIFAPTVAVVKDYRWGRTYEGYSSEAPIPKAYASEIVIGMQGDINELATRHDKVIATAKHFIGDGGTYRGIDQGDTRLSLEALLELHGQGYHSAIDADVQTVMASFNSWNGEKIHGHRQLLTDVLKGQMGFDGILVSDWNGTGQVQGCTDEICAQAINAGIDMVMVPEDWEPMLLNTIEQVKQGLIPMSRIDDAVTRILRVKLRLGLYQKGLPSSRELAGNQQLMGSKQHREIAREAVRKSLVLLKNQQNILPIKPNQHVLVAGDGANDIAKQSGGWTITWQGTELDNSDFPDATSIYNGIQQAVTNNGGSTELSERGEWNKKPDVAVVVFGEEPYAEGQGDVETLGYKGGATNDLQLIQKLKAQNIPVVAVFITGRPLWMNAEINASNAFVVAWLPGSEGQGVADVLVADEKGQARYDFTGRLSFEWPNADINVDDVKLPVTEQLLNLGAGLSYGDEAILSESLRDKPLSNVATVGEVIFAGSSRGAWTMLAGDEDSWRQEIKGRNFVSKKQGLKVSVVNGMVQEDSRLVEWTGKHQSQFYWRSIQAMDMTALEKQNKALIMTYRVDSHPQGSVTQRMDCTWPCAGAQDVTELFAKATLGQWNKAAINLSCFSEAGADLSRINIPFLLTGSDAFAITIKDIRIDDAEPSELIDCKPVFINYD
ncbi:MAG: exo 1,3/1,4-beta-D-glucan glucohydrolase [Cellvibrionales bacterium]|nr:exo 1,3/1,4-beta-D-glucan glucohydrolase [Cellvibrionales bacterium]